MAFSLEQDVNALSDRVKALSTIVDGALTAIASLQQRVDALNVDKPTFTKEVTDESL